MRESNFAFPAQNRACVCISSQLYDRRALDTTSPLPLFNSLTHLAYLTSTSPRIREILTMDGGLERLVRLLRDFCTHPPPPESPTQFYGLLPPISTKSHHPLIHAPYDPKRPFDRAAAYRFSLAFQCVVNIGVRGSEPIRSRVVQAGTLDVVGCVLEAWLASKGFAVGPSVSASGMPRESREQRHARRLAAAEQLRHRELHAIQAQELTRHLQRHIASHQDEEMLDASLSIDTNSDEPTSLLQSSAPPPTSVSDTSNDTSPTSTPRRGSTPSASVPPRDRSSTIVARPAGSTHRRRSTIRGGPDSAPGTASAAVAASAVRTDTEPESDADAEMEDAGGTTAASATAATATAATPSIGPPAPPQQGRRAVGIVGDDDTAALDVDMNLDILLAGATDGFVALGPAGGDGLPLGPTRDDRPHEEDRTPRATFARLPDTHPVQPTPHTGATVAPQSTTTAVPNQHAQDSGPYREEDVLLSLQLLAYLSKYPHVRQAFYKPRAVFNPALQSMQASAPPAPKEASGGGFFRALAGAAVGRGSKDKDKERQRVASMLSTMDAARAARPLTQSTNVFSLVERFTFRPSPSETQQLSVPPPLLPPEIQYWAGVIMRNACRKDESRGGIRQCANMTCGKWESFPREFAKCRRCRKAKYCGKECQSRAWAEGHRFWCSAREEEADSSTKAPPPTAADAAVAVATTTATTFAGTASLDEGTDGTVAGSIDSAASMREEVSTPVGPVRPPSRLPPAPAPTHVATTMAAPGAPASPNNAATVYRTTRSELVARNGPSVPATFSRHSGVTATVTSHQHGQYLHLSSPTGSAGVRGDAMSSTTNVRRYAGPVPGSSISTTSLPRAMREEDEDSPVAVTPSRQRRGALELDDEMVLG